MALIVAKRSFNACVSLYSSSTYKIKCGAYFLEGIHALFQHAKIIPKIITSFWCTQQRNFFCLSGLASQGSCESYQHLWLMLWTIRWHSQWVHSKYFVYHRVKSNCQNKSKIIICCANYAAPCSSGSYSQYFGCQQTNPEPVHPIRMAIHLLS